MRRHHHREFDDVPRLVEACGSRRITVCIPTLDEEETIGDIVSTIRSELMERHPLVHEILVVDSGSSDGTLAVAEHAGATAILARDIRPDLGSFRGKGENLWKGLIAAAGDIVVYLDGDIRGFHPRFVTGLAGPLVMDPSIDFVKAYYERPLVDGGRRSPQGGGRVSEILARPLISLCFPDLGDVIQPLSGEYAARRSLLETLPFPTGYGVELAHLIELSQRGLLSRMAQCDLVERVHRNRGIEHLGEAAFAVLKVALRRLGREDLPDLLRQWTFDGEMAAPVDKQIPEPERPPLRPEG